MSNTEKPFCYFLDEDGDIEYNTIDSFSCGRSGGTPLYLRPLKASGTNASSDGYARPMTEHEFFSWCAHNCRIFNKWEPEEVQHFHAMLRKAYNRGLIDGKKIARAKK